MFRRELVERLSFGAVLFASMLLVASPATAAVPGDDRSDIERQQAEAPAQAAAPGAGPSPTPDSDDGSREEPQSEENAKEEPAGKFSGLVFGDYYYITTHRREELVGQSGFWFRRIYLTYEHKLGGNWDTRIRLEGNSPGRFTVADTIDPFVKDAYLRWRGDSTSVYLGISSPPTWNYIEGFWGYRWLEKTPLDLQRFASSRDFGVAVRGTLDAGKKLHYHVMAGNGSGSRSEVGKGKAVYGSLRYDFSDEFSVEAYVDYKNRDRGSKHLTYQGFAGYQSGSTRVGLQYARQEVDLSEVDGEDFDMNLLSAFVVQGLTDKLTLVVRADRMFDPNPAGEAISYLPFARNAKSLLILAGVDVDLGYGIHLMPNFEWITYEAVDGGDDPDDDLMLRGTFYWSWG